MAKLELFDGTNWIALGGGSGTVTSINIIGSLGLTVSGSPITTSGNINLTLGTELQGLNNLSLVGLVSRTDVGTYNSRSIVAGSGINIANGNGVSGNPTISLGTVPISSLQIPYDNRTYLRGDGTWSTLTLKADTGIYIGNDSPTGVGGNPLIGLSTIPINKLEGYPNLSYLYLNGAGKWVNLYFTFDSLGIQAYSNIYMRELGFFLRSYPDQNHGMLWDSNLDGVQFRGWNGFKWCINNQGQTELMRLVSSQLLIYTNMYCSSTASFNVATAINMKCDTLNSYNNSFVLTSPLKVSGGYNVTSNGFGWLNSTGSTGRFNSTSTNSYGLITDVRVLASEFNAISSIKKKNILSQGLEVEKEVLEIIKKTEFFKYEYKDQITEKGIRYGIIAEELGKAIPDYVDYENMEYIPNIMQVGRLQKIKNTKYQYILNLENKFEIYNNTKKLKLIDTKNKVIEVEIYDILDERTLKINAKEEISEKVFVYGTYEQCPAVATKITELALIAVKNLLIRVENLERKKYD